MTNRTTTTRSQHGVTVVELMVTVAVLAILVGIGLPAMQGTIARHRLIATANELHTVIQRARLEAIRRGVRVTLCKGISSATQCDTNPASDWKAGWILFTDPQTQTPPQIDTGSTIIARGGWLSANELRIQPNHEALKLYVSYTPNGASKLMNGGFLSGRIRVCSTSSALSNDRRAIDIVINSAGRPVFEYPTGVTAACPAN